MDWEAGREPDGRNHQEAYKHGRRKARPGGMSVFALLPDSTNGDASLMLSDKSLFYQGREDRGQPRTEYSSRQQDSWASKRERRMAKEGHQFDCETAPAAPVDG